MENMVEVKNLCKTFAGKEVLKNISISVAKGDVLSIIGPSGSGKSTFLRCLNLLEKPESGIIKAGNVQIDCAAHTRKEEHLLRSQSAMVFQNYNLFKNKTALENITESLITAKKMKKKDANEIGYKLLERVGLSAQAEQYPVTLSGGQQQRVAIARALAVKPAVILLDEPTSALDPTLVQEVLEVILSMVKEKFTMVIVTHEMEFARKVSNRTVFMADGAVIEEGASEELFRNPKDARTQKFLNIISRTALDDSGL